jgi:hypothetical protein
VCVGHGVVQDDDHEVEGHGDAVEHVAQRPSTPLEQKNKTSM